MKLHQFLLFMKNLNKYKKFYYDERSFYNFNDNNKKTKLSLDIPLGKEVVIYGFGPYGKDIFVNYFSNYKINGIYDKKKYKDEKVIKNPERGITEQFDYIIVTVMDDNARKEIGELLEKSIPKEKIVYVDYDFD